MPTFNVEAEIEDTVELELDVTVKSFVDQCSTEELKELIGYLVELKLIESQLFIRDEQSPTTT